MSEYFKSPDGRIIKNIEGQKFNMLTAIRYDHADKSKHSYWLFKCDCGNEKVILANSVTKKNAEVKSCGCQNQKVRLSGCNRRKHGKEGSRLYKVWLSMRRRCNNPHNESYQKWYGAKGIKVCHEWDDFNNFYEWAMKNGYDENADYMKCTLDRIDVNGDYCPDNCRWVDMKVQANNKSNQRHIAFNGQCHTAKEWERIIGISSNVIRARIDSYGWTVEEALTTPLGVRRERR